MNRETRDKLVSGTDQADLTSGNACWETPPLVYDKLNEDFGPFDVDLTADAHRHLCPIWFGPESPVGEFDALTAMWHEYGQRGYSNPPYGPFIQRLLPHAANEARLHGFQSVLLLPMRVTKAFKTHVLRGASDLLFCDSRITFFENGVPRLNEKQAQTGRATADPAVFDSIVVRYRSAFDPAVARYHPEVPELKVGIWQVPKHVTGEDLHRAMAQRTERLRMVV